MQTSTLYLIVALISITNAHMYLSSVTVGGVNQGERKCLRALYGGPTNPIFPNSPINDVTVFPNGLTGANMTCGFLPYAATATSSKCPVTAGSTMGLTWHHNDASASDDIVDSSHKGPCMVYMAKSETGSGAVWFKVFEEGYNFQTSTWCSMRVKAAAGYMEFTIPDTLPSGNYLVRGEIIALHDGTKTNGAQPYVSCAEVTVTGANPGVMPTSDYMVSLPGAYSPTDPGIFFNVYNSFTSYVIPGPKLYTAAAVTVTAPMTSTSTSTSTSYNPNPTSTSTSYNPNPTSTSTSNNPTTATSAGQCGDIVNQCMTLCGARGTSVCKCDNGNPNIVCADAGETSAASTLRPFWFL